VFFIYTIIIVFNELWVIIWYGAQGGGDIKVIKTYNNSLTKTGFRLETWTNIEHRFRIIMLITLKIHHKHVKKYCQSYWPLDISLFFTMRYFLANSLFGEYWILSYRVVNTHSTIYQMKNVVMPFQYLNIDLSTHGKH